MKNTFPLSIALIGFLSLSACATQKPVQAASSANQIEYAQGAPAQLGTSADRLEADYSGANESLDERFAAYVPALGETDWKLVGAIYEKAEEEGQGQSYLTHRAEAAAVLGFYSDEKKTIVSRVAHATSKKAAEKGCDVKLYGSVDWSLQRVIVERLVERRREASDAHQLITNEKKELGKKNAELLAKQADEIMFVSYMVHVGALKQEEELRSRVDESSDVKRTLEDRIESLQEEEKPDDKEISRLQAALDQVEPALKKAHAQLDNAEEKRLQLEEKYKKSWNSLQDELEMKISAAQKEADLASIDDDASE